MTDFTFTKSSYSNGNRECVEVATNIPDTVAIRDSKDPHGPLLVCSPAAWDAFRGGVAAFGRSR